MSTKKEFAKRLRCTEKSNEENLQFAINAWQSLDFNYANKYEDIINWLATYMLPKLFRTKNTEVIWLNKLYELLQLRAQPGLVSNETKSQFIDVLLTLGENINTETRTYAELINCVLNNVVIQDILRAGHDQATRVYAALFGSYADYLTQQQTLRANEETEFFLKSLNLLKEHVKRTENLLEFDKVYSEYVLPALAAAFLKLRDHGLCFFEEFAALEKTLTDLYADKNDMTLMAVRIQRPQQLYVRLLTQECFFFNYRNDTPYQEKVFNDIIAGIDDGGVLLTEITYMLETLRKYDIKMANYLEPLKNQLLGYVRTYMTTHLREVLMLVCAVLRYNPLLIETDVYAITILVMGAQKSNELTQRLFEEYMVLLLDMFRRLSRAERFLPTFLKKFGEWMQKHSTDEDNTEANDSHKKKKRNDLNSVEDDDVATKRRKLKTTTETTDDNLLQPNLTVDDQVYLKILLKDIGGYKPISLELNTDSAEIHESFRDLKTIWPSATVGNAFSKLITNLMSKPSIVIWKTLVYTFKEALEQISTTTTTEDLSPNLLITIDLHAALLCQYFHGTRLAEQTQKFHEDTRSLHELTAKLLAQFGSFILAREHNQRTMKAFLECSYYASAFQMLQAYYLPDGLTTEPTLAPDVVYRQIHGHLSAADWTIIEQRVLNFGKRSCKQLLLRLQRQRKDAELLFNTTTSCLQEAVAAPTTNLVSRSIALYSNVIKLFNEYNEQLENHKVRNSLTIVLKQQINTSDVNSIDDKLLKSMAETINTHIKDAATIKKFPNDVAKQLLSQLETLHIALLPQAHKNLIFLQLVALHSDLRAANADADLVQSAYEYILDFLHFGEHAAIFKYFKATQLLQVFPILDSVKLYELIFQQYIRQEGHKSSKRFLIALAETLAQKLEQQQTFEQSERQLLLLCIETLSGAKLLRAHLDAFYKIYSNYLNSYFGRQSKTELPQQKQKQQEKDELFVQQTLPAYAAYLKAALAQATKEAVKERFVEIDDEFRRINKIYIGYSLNYRNMHSLNLMKIALNHSQQLHFEQLEIELVLSGYWRQLNEDLKNDIDVDVKCTECAIKLIIDNKTNEDLLLTLRKLETNSKAALILLNLIGKCSFSTIKSAIFNEQFRLITTRLILNFERKGKQLSADAGPLLDLLACQQTIVENRTVPLSIDTVDSIIALLININIKEYPLNDAAALKQFKAMHLAMISLYGALFKQRTLLLMDRMPQMKHIFKDLLQAIVWYKSERQNNAAIAEAEIDDLAELAQKLDALMSIIKTQAVAMKRLAPFLLNSAIKLMVTADKRPLTLYPKIKLHIESICYAIIGICDHRAGRFILRNCNEAGRQLYELMHKEHKKYYKFKGKV